jgi:membrane protease YdiL (CAAX protease family)
MHDLPVRQSAALVYLVVLAIGLCGLAWMWVALRLQQRRPIVPFSPRWPAPWNGLHVLAIVLLYFAVNILCTSAALHWLVPDDGKLAPTQAEQSEAAHPLTTLLPHHQPGIVLLVLVLAVVVAPVTEEFVFRLVMQGWLEAAEMRSRRDRPGWRRGLPLGAGPIVVVSSLFGLLHFHIAGPEPPWREVLVSMSAGAVGNLLTFGLGLGLLRWHAHATLEDLGIVPRELLSDLKLGLLTFCAFSVPIYSAQLLLRHVLPQKIAPDPITVFLFALVWGALYLRTHRIMPSIVAHAALNAYSLAIGWASLPG